MGSKKHKMKDGGEGKGTKKIEEGILIKVENLEQ